MNFTREPIIETVITPREGCKLVVRSSKGNGQEDYFVDAVEVVSFGHSFFFRSQERPRAFLVPVSDYEILELKETRMVLKNVSTDRSIKIGGGREAPPRREEPPRDDAYADSRPAPERQPQDRKRDNKRRRGRRGRDRHEPHPQETRDPMDNREPRDDHHEALEEHSDHPESHEHHDHRNNNDHRGSENHERRNENHGRREESRGHRKAEETHENGAPFPSTEEPPKAPSFISKLFPPPPTLIKESLSRYKPSEVSEGDGFAQEEKKTIEETLFEPPTSAEKEAEDDDEE